MPDRYQPRNAFEAAVFELLREIKGSIEENRERLEQVEQATEAHGRVISRVEKPLEFYDRMVPLGLERYLPELLDSQAVRSMLATLQRRRTRIMVACVAVAGIVPGWGALAIALYNLFPGVHK